MHSQYRCIICYKYENDEVGRNLSGKCTVLCYILEYIYIVQITKRRTSHMLAFSMQIPDQVEWLVVFACWKPAQDLCVSLLFEQNLYIFQYLTQNSTFTTQNALSFNMFVLLTMYTFYREYMNVIRSFKWTAFNKPGSSVCRASDLKSQGFEFESHCAQEFFIL